MDLIFIHDIKDCRVHVGSAMDDHRKQLFFFVQSMAYL